MTEQKCMDNGVYDDRGEFVNEDPDIVEVKTFTLITLRNPALTLVSDATSPNTKGKLTYPIPCTSVEVRSVHERSGQRQNKRNGPNCHNDTAEIAIRNALTTNNREEGMNRD